MLRGIRYEDIRIRGDQAFVSRIPAPFLSQERMRGLATKASLTPAKFCGVSWFGGHRIFAPERLHFHVST